METRQEVTFVMRRLFNLIRKLADSKLHTKWKFTPMQGHVIHFIHHHAGEAVYQRDLERAFEIRRSTASAILQTMERKGLLYREPVVHDARLKRLMLTQLATEHHDHLRSVFEEINKLITKDITPDELAAFLSATTKMENNLNEYLAQQGDLPENPDHGEANE